MSDVVVVGAGRMGAPIVGRLVAAGHTVGVRDVRPAVRPAIEAAGAGWLPDQGALHERLAGADVVVTVLPGSPELRAVMLGTAADGDGGILRSLGAQALWIDLTSAAPDLARELADAAASHGARYVDAAIGGGPADAQAGG